MGSEPDPRLLVPAPAGADGEPPRDDEAGAQDAVTDPAKVVRLATMAQVLLAEVADLELDEAARERLASIHNRSVTALAGVLSEELRDELEDLGLGPLADADQPPTADELRVVQSQLVGWLQGLFQGIRAALTTHHLARQEELAEMYAAALQGGGEAEQSAAPGRYL